MKSLLSYTVLLILLLACSTQGRENPEPKSVPPTPTLTAVPPAPTPTPAPPKPTPNWLPNSALEPSPTPVPSGLGLSVSDFYDVFGIEGHFSWRPHCPSPYCPDPDGPPWVIGQAKPSYVADGSSPATIHLHGEPHDLTEVLISVDMDGNRSLNSLYLEAFLNLTMSEWDERFDWFVEGIGKHPEDQRVNSQTTTYNGKRVNYTYNRRTGNRGSGLASILITSTERIAESRYIYEPHNTPTPVLGKPEPSMQAPVVIPTAVPSPTAQPTAFPSPSAIPTPTPRPTPAPKQGLGLNASEIQSAFEKPEWTGFVFTSSTMSNGIPLIKGHTDYQGAILRLYGPPDDLLLVHFSFVVSNGFPVSNVQSFLRAILAWSVQAWNSQSLDDWLEQAVQKYDQTREGTTTVQYGRRIKLAGEDGEAWLRVEMD